MKELFQRLFFYDAPNDTGAGGAAPTAAEIAAAEAKTAADAAILAKHKAGLTPLEQVTADLKEVMPLLLSAKQLKSETDKEIKDLKLQLESMNGNILTIGKNVVEIGNRKIKVVGSDIPAEEKIGFAKYLVDIIRQKQNPSVDTTNRIKEYQAKHFSEAKLKVALNEATDSQGGYGVPEMFRGQIWRIADQASIAKRDSLQVALTPGFKLPTISLLSNVTVEFVDEGASISGIQSEPTFSKTTVSAKKLMGYGVFSNEIEEDEEVGMIDLLLTLFGEKMGVTFDTQAFNGDGTQFTGVLQSSGVNTITLTGTTFASVDFDDLSDGEAALKEAVKLGIRFYLHRTILNVLKKLKDSNGLYIWGPPVAGSPGTIWGIPYTLVETMPALSDTAAGTAFMFLGNMKNYQWGTKGGMTVKVSDIPKILTDQSIMVTRERMALGIGLPGGFSVFKTAASS